MKDITIMEDYEMDFDDEELTFPANPLVGVPYSILAMGSKILRILNSTGRKVIRDASDRELDPHRIKGLILYDRVKWGIMQDRRTYYLEEIYIKDGIIHLRKSLSHKEMRDNDIQLYNSRYLDSIKHVYLLKPLEV